MTCWALRNFKEKYPNPKLALSLRVEDMAWFVLKALVDHKVKGERPRFNLGYISEQITSDYSRLDSRVKMELEKIVWESCQWLANEGLIASYWGVDLFFITRKGLKYASNIDLRNYLLTRYLSVDILHPKIRKIYADFADGEFESAIFKAFKEVEVYAHSLGMFNNSVYGKEVFERLFQKEKIESLPEEYEERNLEHLRGLFRSSYSLLRNSSAHRSVEMPPEEAISIVMIANHGLQILDKFSAVLQQEQKAA